MIFKIVLKLIMEKQNIEQYEQERNASKGQKRVLRKEVNN